MILLLSKFINIKKGSIHYKLHDSIYCFYFQMFLIWDLYNPNKKKLL